MSVNRVQSVDVQSMPYAVENNSTMLFPCYSPSQLSRSYHYQMKMEEDTGEDLVTTESCTTEAHQLPSVHVHSVRKHWRLNQTSAEHDHLRVIHMYPIALSVPWLLTWILFPQIQCCSSWKLGPERWKPCSVVSLPSRARASQSCCSHTAQVCSQKKSTSISGNHQLRDTDKHRGGKILISPLRMIKAEYAKLLILFTYVQPHQPSTPTVID